jgi:hypothetical protein
MSQVEVVALWAGLIASVAGIVLSIAALIFGVWVSNRTTEVNDQTVRSLQKIESTVERLSDDTRSLIKAGWDKMLSSVGGIAEGEDVAEEADRLASGLAEEARAEIGLRDGPDSLNRGGADEKLEKIEEVLQNLQQSVAAQFRNLGGRAGRAQTVDRFVGKLQNLSPESRALLSIIVDGRHLDRKQYQRLSRSATGPSLRELRREGLLVPLSGRDRDRGARLLVASRPEQGGARCNDAPPRA